MNNKKNDGTQIISDFLHIIYTEIYKYINLSVRYIDIKYNNIHNLTFDLSIYN